MLIGGNFGAGDYRICGHVSTPRFLRRWPNAGVGVGIDVMVGERAVSVLATGCMWVRGLAWSAQAWRLRGLSLWAALNAPIMPSRFRPFFLSERCL